MDWFLITLGFLIGNALVGAAVLAAIDDEDEQLYKWCASANQMGFFGTLVQFVTLHAWPVVLWLWWRNHNNV